MDIITIENLVVFAKHGVFPEENFLGQKFLVSVWMETDTRAAGLQDDLSLSTNYGEVSKEITTFMQAHTCKLIEAAAEQLAQHILLTFPLIKGITLEIKKPWAPVGLPLDTVSVKIHRSWHRAYVAMGSNMGDTHAHLASGIDVLKEHPLIRLLKVSSLIVTAPYGGVEQDDFLNGVLSLDTLLSPYELLSVLHEAEQKEMRERLIHWGPRTLDMDLLLYDEEILEEEDLVVPHPEIEKRTFVLEPMAEIAPYKMHPVLHKTMKRLLEELKAEES